MKKNIQFFIDSYCEGAYPVDDSLYELEKENWYKELSNFSDCKSLPTSIFLTQLTNIFVVIYLLAMNIYKCCCKIITNNKVEL